METRFLEAIGADPEDDTVRLVYADWLDENGHPDRAEFLRVQVELARSGKDDARRNELCRREHEILAAHRDEWVGALAGTAPAAAWVFRRGFVDGLDLRGHEIGPAGAAALAASPHLARVTTLDLTGNGIGDVGARALAYTRHGGRLEALDLAANAIDGAALELGLSPFLPRLKRLHLGRNVIRDAGWAALRFALQGERLEVLDLSSNPIPGWGPHPVTSLTYQPRLAALDLSKTLVGDAAVAGLADTPALSALRTLDLSYNAIGDAGAGVLAGSSYLSGLTTLKLEWNRIGDAGAAALRARFGRALRLRSDGVRGGRPAGPGGRSRGKGVGRRGREHHVRERFLCGSGVRADASRVSFSTSTT